MSTGIEWTDETWNPVTGCSRVSPGCDNCYAISMSARIAGTGNPDYADVVEDGDWTGNINLLPHRLDQPLRWQRPRRIFVNSMSDLFHPDVPWRFIARVWAVMHLAKAHQFQILTKRPQRMARLLSDAYWEDRVYQAVEAIDPTEVIEWQRREYPEIGESGWLPNVWLGTSIESDRYTFRANHLRETPAAVRFLSLEPLLGPLPSLDLTGIDWVIVGGESGPGARPMHRGWVRDIRDRCVDAGVPFFLKQLGAWASYTDGELHTDRLDDGCTEVVIDRDGRILGENEPCDIELEPSLMLRVGKKAAGRTLDGRTWDEYPEAVPA